MRHISRNAVRIAMLTLLSGATSACVFQRAQEASDAQSAMVGMSKEQVLACMGSPANTAVAGTTEVWTYNSGNGREDSVGVVNAWGGYGWASGFGSVTTTQRFCKVDVVMNMNRVSRINYTGPTGGLLTKGEQCGFAIDNCMQQATTFAQSPIAAIAPAPIAAASASRSTEVSSLASAAAGQAAQARPACSKDEQDLANWAKRNGYQYAGSCN